MPGVILINPDVFQDKRDALAVAWNEALRLTIEDIKFEPKFEITPAQVKFFRNTAYSQDESALRKTIVARIATHDTSVSPSPEQEKETVRLLDLILEMPGISTADLQAVTKMKESVAGGGARGPVRPPPKPQEGDEEAEVAETKAPELEAEGAGVQAADAAGDVRSSTDILTPAAVVEASQVPGTAGLEPIPAFPDLSPAPVTPAGAKPAATMSYEVASKIADHVYKQEGGAKTKFPYGIKRVKVSSVAEARAVSIRTIRNNYDRWVGEGKPGDYFDYLADKYVPIKDDPEGNKNWKAYFRQAKSAGKVMPVQ